MLKSILISVAVLLLVGTLAEISPLVAGTKTYFAGPGRVFAPPHGIVNGRARTGSSQDEGGNVDFSCIEDPTFVCASVTGYRIDVYEPLIDPSGSPTFYTIPALPLY